jgi:hypothetical protein
MANGGKKPVVDYSVLVFYLHFNLLRLRQHNAVHLADYLQIRGSIFSDAFALI